MNPNIKKLSNESIFEYNFIGELEELKKNIKKKSKERIEEIIEGNETYVERVKDPELVIILTRILKSQI